MTRSSPGAHRVIIDLPQPRRPDAERPHEQVLVVLRLLVRQGRVAGQEYERRNLGNAQLLLRQFQMLASLIGVVKDGIGEIEHRGVSCLDETLLPPLLFYVKYIIA